MKGIENWKPGTTLHTALARNVLAVAHVHPDGTWTAYVAPVLGVNHAAEESMVLATGTKLGERIALALFPEMDAGAYRR